MVALAVIFTIILFLTADFGVRTFLLNRELARKLKERRKALAVSLDLSFAEEAKSLRRVEVPDPLARILAVDDEEVVLESIRRILVTAGFSVDTVESGHEALTLVQKNEYDFVLTDLRMPEMDGVEVVKAVKFLSPAADVVVITGYASIESAVETLKMGAMDYVQKPFTDDELTESMNRFLMRRNEGTAVSRKPKVHLVTPSVKQAESPDHFNVMSGIFISSGHTWISIEPNGLVTVGIDDFAQKLLGEVGEVTPSPEGKRISKGQEFVLLRNHRESVSISSPVTGVIKQLNFSLLENPTLINRSPYETGWICRMEPSNLPKEIASLRMGADAVSWYQAEVDRYFDLLSRAYANETQDRNAVKEKVGLQLFLSSN